MTENKRKSQIKIIDLTTSSGGSGGGVTPSQMNAAIANAVGKGLEVGFDGTLEGNVITFAPPESTGAYNLKEDYDYIVDLSFPAVGTLDDAVEMEIENDSEVIQFFTINHTDVTTSATVADLKDVMRYDEATGYRWVFRARCHITSSSSIKCFVILPTVQQPSSGGGVTEEELASAISTHNTSTLSHEDIREQIESLELYKTPNAVIKGNPTINNGQVSDFSEEDYLMFPFVVDLSNKAFEIYFSFTPDQIAGQYNIIDSNFGIAIAIVNANMVLAMSSDGETWDICNNTGSYIINNGTTYYGKLTGDGYGNYEFLINTAPERYTSDISVSSDKFPHPTTIFIGGGTTAALGHSSSPFSGIIDLNKAKLVVNDNETWKGMDDVGIATRMATNMANIDSEGIEFIQDLIDASTPTATTSHIGLVKPDGTSITIDTDGTIHSSGTGGGNVDDVKVNGTSVVTDKVANIPVSSSSTLGVVKVDGTTITAAEDGTITSVGGGVQIDDTTASTTTVYSSSKTESLQADVNDALTLLNGGEETLLNNKANTDLDNLSTIGQGVLDNKMNIDFSNCTGIYLKTAYVSGTSGYRIWSDGYCEQWGYVKTSASSVAITFTKTFANSSYNRQVTIQGADGDYNYHIITTANTTGMTIFARQPAYWRASGKLASGQY